ncbi:MAG: sulfatase, partial [Acidobacteriota bacterium]|nr:sulfatase [Acidobacteriota bacterium]
LACASPPDQETTATAPRVTRILEQLRPAEVREPETEKVDWPGEAKPSRLVRGALRSSIARVALEEEEGVVSDRKSLFGPAGTSFRPRVNIPARTSLRFGIGAPGLVPGEGSVRFVVRAGPPGRLQVVFEQELTEPGWVDGIALLEMSSGAKTRISLESAGSGSGRWAAWSAPEIVRSDPELAQREDLNVVLVSLDTLRADRLGSYGYQKPTSPFLDSLAAGSFRFATAVSAAPWTLPSHRALFTGLYPTSRGGRSTRPLADVLWRAGYRTEGWAGGGVMDHRMGFARGFDNYRGHDWINDLDRLTKQLAESRDRKRFVFLHTYEPHDPYIHTEFAEGLPSGRLKGVFDKDLWIRFDKIVTADERDYVRALYDGDIAYTDRQLGELFERLETSGSLEQTIIVVTSDHGEQFWEHGTWRHGQTLYDHQLLVPLILHLPRSLREGLGIDGTGVINDQVRLIDVYPTLLDLLGIELEKETQGRSLVPLLLGQSLPPVDAIAESLNVDNKESKAVRSPAHKFIRTRSSRPGATAPWGADELYDLHLDPKESRNLATEQAERAALLSDHLESLTEGAWGRKEHLLERGPLDPDLEKRLKALGYLGN